MMIWNSSFRLLGFSENSAVLVDGTVHKMYSHPVQYAILRRFFGRQEVSLDLLREVYKDTYALHDILEAFYGFVQDRILVTESFFKIVVEFPEEPSFRDNIVKLIGKKLQIDPEQPQLTIFIIGDPSRLKADDLLKIKSDRFTLVWIFGKELKLFPVFDKADITSFYAFLNRIKRVFYSQILTSVNNPRSVSDLVETSSLGLILDYVPEFIYSGEARNVLLAFDPEKLEIRRIPVHKSLLQSPPVLSGDILNKRKEPADVTSVFRRLSFHLKTPLGPVDRLKSEQTPLGGWVSSGGWIYRSNKISNELFFSRARAGGNGVTQKEAEAKAFCETLERYSQVFRAHEDEYIIDTYKNLGPEAIHPDEILLYSPDQYRRGMARNQMGVQLIPFDENRPIAWSYVYDHLRDVARRIPTFLLYLGLPAEDTASENFFKWITNGTAAGSTLEMARLHALYELIERDACAIRWYNRLPGNGVDVQSIAHLKAVAPVLKEHQRLGKRLYVFDITPDIRIPTVAVFSDYLPGTYLMACGTNISFEKACEKAFGELNQLYLYHRVRQTRLNEDQLEDIARMLQHHQPQQPIRPLGTSPLPISAELKTVEAEIRKRGLDIYYKDFSRQDVLLPVVKAIVPGMRDLDTRFAAGRLYSTVRDLYGYMPAEHSLRNFNLF